MHWPAVTTIVHTPFRVHSTFRTYFVDVLFHRPPVPSQALGVLACHGPLSADDKNYSKAKTGEPLIRHHNAPNCVKFKKNSGCNTPGPRPLEALLQDPRELKGGREKVTDFTDYLTVHRLSLLNSFTFVSVFFSVF